MPSCAVTGSEDLNNRKGEQPVPGEQMYIWNESWSDMRSWWNDSLGSCELVLSRLGLRPVVEQYDGCSPKYPPADPGCVEADTNIPGQ